MQRSKVHKCLGTPEYACGSTLMVWDRPREIRGLFRRTLIRPSSFRTQAGGCIVHSPPAPFQSFLGAGWNQAGWGHSFHGCNGIWKQAGCRLAAPWIPVSNTNTLTVRSHKQARAHAKRPVAVPTNTDTPCDMLCSDRGTDAKAVESSRSVCTSFIISAPVQHGTILGAPHPMTAGDSALSRIPHSTRYQLCIRIWYTQYHHLGSGARSLISASRCFA